MTIAANFRETPIPPPQPDQPDLTPQAAAGLCAAMRDLVWLAIYVTVMRLLGYRIRRPVSRRAYPRPSTRTNAKAPRPPPPSIP
jgi:hypothetical protein